MRLFKSTAPYEDYVCSFYRHRPGLADKSFSEQMDALLADISSFGDAWKHYLEATGRYEVMEVALNAEPAQKRWALEHGLATSLESWSEEVLAAQLAYFQPDIWFSHGWLSPGQRLRLRRACSSIRCVVGYDGALVHDPKALEGCDVVLTCVHESAAFYSRFGMRGYWLPWGFDPRVCAHLKPAATQKGVVFCGSISLRSPTHFGRVDLLDALRPDFDLKIHVPNLNGVRLERELLSAAWHRDYPRAWKILCRYPSLRRLRSINAGSVYGLAMLQVLSESKFVLNLHGDAVRTAANIRLFEATGVGACLLTDWMADLPAVFEPDREVVRFRSPPECAEKLRYLLDHEKERCSIAAAGQRRCLRDHNIGDHILEFAEEVLHRL